MAPPRDEATETDPAPPGAFATGSVQDRDELRAADLRSAPRPSLLTASIQTLSGAGPKLAAAAAAEHGAGLTWATSCSTSRTPTATGPSRASSPSCGSARRPRWRSDVRSARVRPTRRRGLVIVEATVADDSGPAKAVWFNQAWLVDRLHRGDAAAALRQARPLGLSRGGARGDRRGRPAATGIHTTGIVPVHPAIGAAARAAASRVGLAGAGRSPAARSSRFRPSFAPAAAWRGAGDALAAAHFPESLDEAEEARGRLAFEELFLHQVALAARRSERRASHPGIALDAPGELVERWLAVAAVRAHRRSAARRSSEIDADLAAERPMQRLLMGEVGSGKTVLALYAMLRAVEAGYQAALMAPTETLAEQHAASRSTRLLGDRVDPVHAPDQRDAGCAPPRGARAACLGRARDGRRHPRPDRARRRVRPPGRLRRRRAAPLRRPPARGARRQGARRAAPRTRST